MSKKAGTISIALWLLLVGIALIRILTAPPVQSDLAQFLPTGQSEQQQLLLDEISVGSGSRLLIVAISGGTQQQRISSSRTLVTSLHASGLFERVLNGEQQIVDEERNRLFSYRYLLQAPGDYSIAGLRKALETRFTELASPLSLMDKDLLPADPTSAIRSLLQSWQPKSGPSRRGGVWISKDGNQVLLLLQTRAQAFELDQQQHTINTVVQAFHEHSEAASLTMELTGGPLFGVESRRTISTETRNLTIIASLGVALLLWWLFRSIPVLVVAVLPLFSAILIGTATVIFLFGAIHGITLAFGITLIGITVDYPIHFFSHFKSAHRKKNSLRHLWSTLLLGVITTVLGFSSLIFSGFNGLSQLGVFAVAGLVAAALVTRFILPRMVPHIGGSIAQRVSLQPLFVRVLSMGRISLIPVLFLAVGTIYLFAVSDSVWETKLSKLSPISEEAKSQYDRLRDELGVEDAGRLFLIRAVDQQRLLEKSEVLDRLLNKATAEGVLDYYDVPSHYIPSVRSQLERQSLLPDGEVLEANLQAASKGLPFKSGLFIPFLRDIDKSRTLSPLTLDELSSTALGVRVELMLRKRGDQWLGLVRLTGVSDEDALRELAKANSEWLSYMNLHQESSQIVMNYLYETIYYFSIAALLITALLIVVMRSAWMTWRVILPVVAALTVSASLQVFLGERLSLFHVAALLLVMGFGLDYAIFVVRTPINSPSFSPTMTSLLICNVSTLLVFGLLAFSNVPVLHSIGLTVTIGSVAALLFSFMMVRQELCSKGGFA